MNDPGSEAPEGAVLTPTSSSATTAAEPFGFADLVGMARSPSRVLDMVLAERPRLAASIALSTAPWTLVAVLVLCTAVASLPYGVVDGWSNAWRVAALYGGSVLLCWPSLQVFGAYLGSSLRPLQNLALSLLIASVAALFSLGFAPIVWFLRATMVNGDWIDGNAVYVVLLAFGLFAGLGQFSRCVAGHRDLRPFGPAGILLLSWQVLVVFVTWRMARALGLVG